MSAADRSPGTRPEHWEPVEPDIPALHSLARELVGNPAESDPDEFDVDPDEPPEPDPPRPASMLELDRYDQIVSFGTIEAPPCRRPLDTVRYEHLTVTKWLDRFGFMTTEQLRRAVLPDATLRATQDLLRRMRDAGLVERRRLQLSIEEGRRPGGSTPRLYSLTPAGHRLGQRSPGFYGSVIPRTGGRRRSEARTTMHLRHDLHGVGWWQAFEAALSPAVGVTDVLTPRYDEGRIQAPRIHIARGRGWRPVELRDIWLAEQYAIAGIPREPFDYTIEPDLTIRLEILGWLIEKTDDINIDLLVEIDRTQKPAKNLRKFQRYDQFLTGWGLLHSRVEQLETRPIAIFTSPNQQSMLALMKAADEVMTGRLGWTGDPALAWYYPGRDHVLFTTETEIHPPLDARMATAEAPPRTTQPTRLRRLSIHHRRDPSAGTHSHGPRTVVAACARWGRQAGLVLTTTLRSTCVVAATWLEVIRWLGVFAVRIVPRVRVELGRWEHVARAVPDPTLRGQALNGLHEKRSNAEAAAVFSILSPRRARADVVALLVALQVLTDYLDTVSEAAVAEPLRNSLALHEALVDAVGDGSSSDYYRRHPRCDDGGYVAELVAFCQQRVRALPALDAVRLFLNEAAWRCAAGQSYTHAAIHCGSDELEAWAAALASGTGYRWWEVAAGASSSVAVHALVASAADHKTTTQEARHVDATYFLGVGSLTVLLDNLADRSADLAAGTHNYLGYYASVEDAGRRLAAISKHAARSARRGRRPRRHAVILAGVLGFYLSAEGARSRYGRVVRAQLMASRGLAVRPVLGVMRVRRALSSVRAWPIALGARRAGWCSRRRRPGSS